MPTEPAPWAEDKPVARLARAYLAATRQASIQAGFDGADKKSADRPDQPDIVVPTPSSDSKESYEPNDPRKPVPPFPRLNTNPGDPRLKKMAKELSKYLKVDSDTAARLSLVYHCCPHDVFAKFLSNLSALRTGIPIQMLVVTRWRKGQLFLSMANGPLDLQMKAGRIFPTTQCIPVMRLGDVQINGCSLCLKADDIQTELKFNSEQEPSNVLDIINIILGRGNPLYDLNREDSNVFCPFNALS